MKTIASATAAALLALLLAGCAEGSNATRVDACVDATQFGVQIGDVDATEMWNAAGQSEDALRRACNDLATNDPEALTAMEVEWQATLHAIDEALVDSSTAPDRRCDPSYPAMCIRMDEADLDCSNVGATGFPVLAPDRHGLDTDGDGFGCVVGADTG